MDNIEIVIKPVFENRDIVICEKPPHILTLPAENGERSLIDYLAALYREKGEAQELFPVHRLDRGTGGLVVFAKNKRAAKELSAIFSEHRNEKEYLAVLDGVPSVQEAELRDILFADKRANKSFIVDRQRKGAKEALLSYRMLSVADTPRRRVSLVRVALKTGRMHQIRAQLSHRGLPLLGDGKYGSHDNSCSMSLWATRLAFSFGGKGYEFFSFPSTDGHPWSLFKTEIENLKSK